MDSELNTLRIPKEQKASRRGSRGWLWVILIVIVLGGAGAALTKWSNAAGGAIVHTIQVRMPEGAVNDSDLVVLNATGYLAAAHKIELASKVIGRVAWVGVEMGDKVKKGQVLVRLEDDEYNARVAQQQGQVDNARARLAELEAGSRAEEIGQAAAEVAQAKADLDNANLTLKRLNDLGSTSAVSQQEVDDATMVVRSRQAVVDARQQHFLLVKAGPRKEQIDAQRALVRQLEAVLAQATLDLDNTIIRAPTDSTVLSRNVEVGEFVTNGFVGDRGAKGYVVSLADLNDLRVELDVSQNDFAKVEARQPCWITTDAYPDRRYDGIVDLISPEANRQKMTIQVRVKVLKPDDLLKPDMNATVSFLSPRKIAAAQAAAATMPTGQRPVLRVPASAVRDGAVFVIESGKAVHRPVTAGSTSTDGIEIRGGLSGGEELVIDPPAGLKDGDAVRVAAPTN